MANFNYLLKWSVKLTTFPQFVFVVRPDCVLFPWRNGECYGLVVYVEPPGTQGIRRLDMSNKTIFRTSTQLIKTCPGWSDLIGGGGCCQTMGCQTLRSGCGTQHSSVCILVQILAIIVGKRKRKTIYWINVFQLTTIDFLFFVPGQLDFMFLVDLCLILLETKKLYIP